MESEKYFVGSFSQPYGYGYYAYADNDGNLVIGEERGREGGELYRGEYKGINTPYMNNIKKESIKLYNSIASFFDKEGTMAERYAREYFEQFMKRRGCKNTTELVDYVMYLEGVKHGYEVLKNEIANLNRLAEKMY